MTENTREVELRATMDATGVRAGAEQAKAAIGDLAAAAERDGARAGAGLSQAGQGAERAGAKVDRETRSMIASIERASAAAQAGGRGTAEYFEQLAKQRGVSADALRPYLDQLRQVEAAQKAAASSLGGIGLSANQTTAALRQVPAQFTDIITSLQGGQNPLTVFLQQGGQLRDIFGSASDAARALGGYVLGLVNPFTVAAAAATALSVAYLRGPAEAREFERALVLSGNAAGATVEQLRALAAAQDAVVGTQGKAAEVLTALAATGRVSAEVLSVAAEAATRLERVGIPLDSTIKKFAELGKDPLKSLLSLNEAENFLTEAVYRQIKALESQGKTAEAVKLAQEEYARVSIARAAELEANLGLLERAWRGVKDGAKEAWDSMLNVGRADTLAERAAMIRKELVELEKSRVKSLGSAAFSSAPSEYVKQLQAELDAITQTIRATEAKAKAQQDEAERVRALAKAEEEAARAAREMAVQRDRDAAALEKAIGLSGSYQKDLAELDGLRRRGLLTERQYVAAVEDVIRAQPMVREQLQAQAQAQQAAARALDDLMKAEARRIEGIYKSAAGVQESIARLQDEEKATALAAAGSISLAEAIERIAIARLEEAHARATQEQDYGAAAALREEIAAREKLAGLIGAKEARETTKRGAEEAAREWRRTTDQIEQSLTDALLRGFESGKGFAENMRDTVVNMFKTLVLRPLIQPIMGQVAGGIGGFLGLSGTASAGSLSGGAGGLGSLGQLGQLGSLGQLGQFLGFGGGGSLPLGAGGALESVAALNGAYAGSLTQSLAALGPIAALAAAGYFGGKAIAGNYSIGGSANASGGLGAALGIGGAALYGPLGAAVGGVLGGVINRAFGRGPKETQGQGLTGTASSEGFAGQAFSEWLQKGGWFRSDKRGTDYSAVSAEQDGMLDAGIRALYDVTAQYADVLGLPVESVKGYAASFKVLWGDTDEANQKAIQDAFANLGEQLAAQYSAQLAPLQKAGESLAATLQRLSTLQGFSSTLNALGGVFSRVAGSSVDARERLIELAGGMESLGQQALAFAQNYYSREEIAGLKARDVQAALGAAGVTADISTREQFRALVEGLDPTTAAGREQLAALLQLQGSFATLADYLTETGLSLAQAASQAPAIDSLVSPLMTGVGQQVQLAQQAVDVQYETRDATLQVVEAVKSLTEAIRTGSGGVSSGWVPSYAQPEVMLAV